MSLARGLVGYAPAVIVPRLLTLAQVTLLTRFIPQAEFGRLVLVMTIGDAIDALCCNWLRVVLSRYGAGRPAHLAEEAALSFLSFAVCTGLFALPAAFLVAHATAHVETGVFFASLAAYLVTNGIARITLAILSLRGFKLAFFTVEAVRSGFGFAAVIGLAVTRTASDYASLVMAMNAATAIAAVIGVAFSLKGIGLRWPDTWGWDRRGYAIPLVAGTVVGVAINSSDRLVTEAFAGPAALATYAAAVTLARQPLEFIFSVVNVRTFPELMEAYEKGGPRLGSERMADLITIMCVMSLPAALGLMLVADPLARTVLSPVYAEAARTVIPLGALAGLCIGFKMFVFDQPLHMTKTIWLNTVVTAAAMVAGVSLTAYLASRHGAVGCVVGLLIQSAAALGISVTLSARAIPLKLHRDDLARVGLMCASMAVAVVLATRATAAQPAAVELLAGILAGGVSYGLAGWLLMPKLVNELLPRRRSGQPGALAHESRGRV